MLSDFQQRVARLFLGLPEAEHYALAGGAALVLRGIVDRDTKDLDFFAPVLGAVLPALHAFVRALEAEGLHPEVLRSGQTFARVRVDGPEGDRALVEIGYDYRLEPTEDTVVGPTLTSRELAADKLLALFGRSAARDFVDVYHLAAEHGIDAMLDWAKQKDTGLDLYYLAIAMDAIERHPRDEFAVDDDTMDRLRDFFAQLRADLVERSLHPEGAAE